MKKNSLVKRSAGAVASLALVAGAVAMASSPAAADTTPTDVEIEEGEISMSMQAVSFPAVEFGYDDRETDSESKLQVTDERGTDAGWTITGEASPLNHTTYDPGAHDPTLQIPSSGLEVTGFDNYVSDNDAQMGDPGQLDVPLVLMGAEAGDGAGDSSADILLKLTVPGSTQLGAYTGVITYTRLGPYIP